MLSESIGVSTDVLLIVSLSILKRIDKQVFYGLVLAGIGFLYVGLAWTNLESLIINSIQAFAFGWVWHYEKHYILATGYFLHGAWDLAYDILRQPDLLLPHYDLFCLSFDFTLGIYLLIFARNIKSKVNVSNI